MKFTPQRVKSLHSRDGVNYSLDFFFKESTNRILKEIAVLECENGKSFRACSLRARSHNLFIDFLNVSVLSDTVVYSAIYTIMRK